MIYSNYPQVYSYRELFILRIVKYKEFPKVLAELTLSVSKTIISKTKDWDEEIFTEENAERGRTYAHM